MVQRADDDALAGGRSAPFDDQVQFRKVGELRVTSLQQRRRRAYVGS